MKFYLGTHRPPHLAQTDVPLFLSRNVLFKRKTFPRALGRWALDSGGFTELQRRGRWTVSASEYVRDVRRYRDEVGGLDWAAPQDWMCEEVVIKGGTFRGVHFVGTGLSVEEHQRRTVDNFLELRSLAPELPFVPVLQGWRLADYIRCVEMYDRAGVDLRTLPTVGVGSICRRQNTDEAAEILWSIALLGIRIHGFGVKMQGIDKAAQALVSGDSMAWSDGARRRKFRLPGCTTHQNCANCLKWALEWRAQVVDRINHVPFSLFDMLAPGPIEQAE